MEALILAWYVLVATGSVGLLVVFGALQWTGSLISPLFGVAGDRIGHRALLCASRATYVLLAGTLMLLTTTGALQTWHVFVIASLTGLLRPSDMVMRHALIGQTMPAAQLLGALAVSRTTADTAKIAGAIAGTTGVAVFGMGPAYVVVTVLYFASFLLSLGVAGAPVRSGAARHKPATPLRDLRQGFTYTWETPAILGAMALAFLANLLAFPFVMGVLPYVAKEVYGAGQTGLGYLAAAFAVGGLVGSLALSANLVPLRPARTMLVAGAVWFLLLLAFAHTRSLVPGMVILGLTGMVHNFCLMPLAAVMLRTSAANMRGRVMGMRMLAIWGLPAGLLLSGPLIAGTGFAAAASVYALLGLALTLAIARRWRAALWHLEAPANARV